MSSKTYMWRVGNIPLDVEQVEPGKYRWEMRGTPPHEARMVEKGNWTLTLRDGTPVQIGLPSLRACVARSLDMPTDAVRSVGG